MMLVQGPLVLVDVCRHRLAQHESGTKVTSFSFSAALSDANYTCITPLNASKPKTNLWEMQCSEATAVGQGSSFNHRKSPRV